MFELILVSCCELLYVVYDKRPPTIYRMQRCLCVQEIFCNCFNDFSIVQSFHEKYVKVCVCEKLPQQENFSVTRRADGKKITQFTSDGGNIEFLKLPLVSMQNTILCQQFINNVFSRCIIYQVNFIYRIYRIISIVKDHHRLVTKPTCIIIRTKHITLNVVNPFISLYLGYQTVSGNGTNFPTHLFF